MHNAWVGHGVNGRPGPEADVFIWRGRLVVAAGVASNDSHENACEYKQRDGDAHESTVQGFASAWNRPKSVLLPEATSVPLIFRTDSTRFIGLPTTTSRLMRSARLNVV